MKPRGERRFTWWRAYHGMPTHPKWRIVARKSGCPVSSVFHIAIILMDVASRGRPRGSIAEFSHVDCAGAVDLDEADILRVLDALEDIHWVEGHMISTWDERQPERDGTTRIDRTAAERQKRFRERNNRYGKEALRNGEETLGNTPDPLRDAEKPLRNACHAMSRPPDLEKKDILASTELVEGQKEARQESKKFQPRPETVAVLEQKGWIKPR